MAMPSASNVHCIFFLAVLSATRGSREVEYSVSNRAEEAGGGRLFDERIGAEAAIAMMKEATFQLESLVFQINHPFQRKEVERVTLFIQEMDSISRHRHVGDEHQIFLSAEYIEKSNPNHLKSEVNYLICYEMAHVWQWTGKGGAPQQLTEGIAFYAVFLILGRPTGEIEVGRADSWSWKKTPQIISQFLFFCVELKSDFVSELNEKMKTCYDDRYFKDLLDHPIDQLWEMYKNRQGERGGG